MPPTVLRTIGAHRLTFYSAFSTMLVSAVVALAFKRHSNFYSATVFLSKSSGSVMALANFGVLMTLLVGRLLQTIFFGQLRPSEIERLYDRMWYFLTESLLAFTTFRDEFDTPFVIMFGALLFLKCFHWLVSDRIEWMDQLPYPGPPIHSIVRCTVLLGVLWAVDFIMLAFAVESLLTHGVGGIVLFGSEYAILLASVVNSMAKFFIVMWGLSRARTRGGEDAPLWEDKSMWIFYVELVTDFFKLSCYLTFFAVVTRYYGLPLNIVRDVYVTTRSFYTRARDLIRYRAATKNMEQKYPNATPQELNDMSDRTCIICREEMVAPPIPVVDPLQPGAAQQQPVRRGDGPNDTPKKLPCGHVFHFHCLRSWLERQQSCPTCRRSVLENVPQTNPTPAPQPGQAPIPPNLAQNENAIGGVPLALLNRFFPQQPGAPNQQFPQQPPAQPQQAQPIPPIAGGGVPVPPRPFQGFQAAGGWYGWEWNPNANAPAVPAPGQAPHPPTHPQQTPAPTPTVPATGATSPISPTSPPTPSSAREAAAQAALRRFNSTSAPTTVNGNAATVPSSTTAKPPGPEGSFTFTTPKTSPKSTLPSLIPLFDPHTTLATTFPQRMSRLHIPNVAGPSTHSQYTPVPPLPPGIVSEAQLKRLDKLTREGIDERLKVLEDVQATLWRASEDLIRVRSVLPSASEGPGPGPSEENGKGKEKAREGDTGDQGPTHIP